ncbi:hypothetical protein V493_03052 [Pseudogymnoascus sp. VKM F-4281 (FW-2241)]|nr:hypothetical protein V493_03052 [Pseudogymnoascus sp. VKM F-4281 (FW-2241)]
MDGMYIQKTYERNALISHPSSFHQDDAHLARLSSHRPSLSADLANAPAPCLTSNIDIWPTPSPKWDTFVPEWKDDLGYDDLGFKGLGAQAAPRAWAIKSLDRAACMRAYWGVRKALDRRLGWAGLVWSIQNGRETA